MAGVTVADRTGHPAAHNNRGLDVTLPPYRAVGDGVTDDQAAIQAAIDTGEPVFLPAGHTFGVSAPLTLNTNFQHLRGGGWTARLKALSTIDAVVVADARGLNVGEFDIESDNKATYGLVLHDAGGASRFERIRVQRATSHGVLFDNDWDASAGNNIGAGLHEVQSQNNGGAGFAAHLEQGDNNSILFVNCWAQANASHGFFWNGRGTSFLNCLSEANDGWGWQFGQESNAGTTVVGNSMLNCWLEGNDLGGIVTHKAVRNSFLMGSGQEWDWETSTSIGNIEIRVSSSSWGQFNLKGDFVQSAGGRVGFYGASPVPQPSITGSTDSAKIDSVIATLAALGLGTDNTT